MRPMKDSGIEWIGEIPENWKISKIKRLYLVINGSTPKSDKAGFWGGDIVWITPSDMNENTVELITSKRMITDEGINACGTTLVPANSIILSTRAPIGQICLAGRELCTNQGCKTLVIKFDSNHKYHYYYLLTQKDTLNMLGRGTTFLELSTLDLANFPIPSPPLPEQTLIASFLDKKCAAIDSAIKNQRASIDKLKEYRQSVITEAVTKGLNPDVPMKDSGVEWIGEIPEGWDIVPLTKQLESIVDYRGKTPHKVDEGVFLITAKNIKSGKIDYDLSKEYVPESEYEKIMHRGKPMIGDVLFTTEAPLGEVANIDNVDIALAQRIIKFRPINAKLSGYFLKYWIMSTYFQNILQSLSTGSTAVGIKSSKLFMLPLTLCSLSEQTEIAAYLDEKCSAIDETVSGKEKLIEKLEEYKKSLIYEAVTGKIEVPT